MLNAFRCVNETERRYLDQVIFAESCLALLEYQVVLICSIYFAIQLCRLWLFRRPPDFTSMRVSRRFRLILMVSPSGNIFCWKLQLDPDPCENQLSVSPSCWKPCWCGCCSSCSLANQDRHVDTKNGRRCPCSLLKIGENDDHWSTTGWNGAVLKGPGHNWWI